MPINVTPPTPVFQVSPQSDTGPVQMLIKDGVIALPAITLPASYFSTIIFPDVTSITGTVTISAQHPFLKSIQFPNATSVANFAITANPQLVTLSLPSVTAWTGTSFVASGGALTAAAVNAILISFDSIVPALSSGTITLNGGTNAAPTGAGITAKASLIAKGLTVTTT